MTYLEEHFAFKGQQALFPGPDQQADALVVDGIVNLQREHQRQAALKCEYSTVETVDGKLV